VRRDPVDLRVELNGIRVRSTRSPDDPDVDPLSPVLMARVQVPWAKAANSSVGEHAYPGAAVFLATDNLEHELEAMPVVKRYDACRQTLSDIGAADRDGNGYRPTTLDLDLDGEGKHASGL
jgi:hypothetical protein